MLVWESPSLAGATTSYNSSLLTYPFCLAPFADKWRAQDKEQIIMEKDYITVIEKYSWAQLKKANQIISEMLACAEDAKKEESNFGQDVEALKKVQSMLEMCINYDPSN